eukprot:CAMPEP_0116882866 /NCGR_PEP_ID=MMETSP0463-20121206/15269_1 /TAXON_ID=181622 /ORGANISM="Strombidinopsis sp, Strain SopsisLIS2011" /LENGTH=84 /DNA_ID=CAMNT_0004536821 /DNA_START=982 /DNA_END=1236 /DNA_ORIENTATION=+
MKDAEGEDILVEDNRTFFCSELIAKSYKVLGIMEETDMSSAKFMPGSFSEVSKDLVLKSHAKLGEEFLVDPKVDEEPEKKEDQE